ncbi:hypothetical protein CDAR_526471 [Caerostris darwini]|uniref:Uncharacterized protein n=1 Tax=Caerostris darwini TaxID=1538125 RepID=A0AAV4T2P5_9ARAC|nr:hypothetical protein CDAR_526471 [Caerostris darwini]
MLTSSTSSSVQHLNWFLLPNFTSPNNNLLPSSVTITSNNIVSSFFQNEVLQGIECILIFNSVTYCSFIVYSLELSRLNFPMKYYLKLKFTKNHFCLKLNIPNNSVRTLTYSS